MTGENGDTERTRSERSRRRFLAASGTVAAVGLAGCSGGGPSSTPPGGGTSTSTSTPTPTVTATLPECDSPEELSAPDYRNGGTITSGCYRAPNGLVVTDGTLTIEAGVVIQFGEDAGLDVQPEGRLQTKGTASRPVHLTGTTETRGHWYGVRYKESRGPANSLSHTTIEYGGSGTWHGGGNSRAGIFAQGDTSLTLDNVTLRENGQAGLVMMAPKSKLSMSAATFEANGAPAWVHPNNVDQFGPDTTVANNDANYVSINGGGSQDYLTREGTWTDPGVPFHVVHGVTLQQPLTIADGTTMTFAKTVGMDVPEKGTLTVSGGAENPVTFTGREEGPESWRGIRIVNSGSDNVIENAIVEYAGDARWHGGEDSRAGIFVQGDDAVLTVRNSTIRENGKVGLTAGAAATELTIEGNVFENNPEPLWLAANLVSGVTPDNVFQGNDGSYVLVGVHHTATPINESATWRNLDVPYRPRINVDVNQPLTVESGTTFVFEQGAGLMVQNDGRLMADASDQETITFTGVEAISGFWKGIYFYNSLSPDNVIRNAVIEYGGSSGWHGGTNSRANLFLRGGDNAGACEISNSTIRGSGHIGISIETDSRLSGCTGMTFENNTGPATYNDAIDGPIAICQ